MSIELTGSCKDGRIWLDSSEVEVADTFMGLEREHRITLYNDSNCVVKFSWCKYESVEQDNAEMDR